MWISADAELELQSLDFQRLDKRRNKWLLQMDDYPEIVLLRIFYINICHVYFIYMIVKVNLRNSRRCRSALSMNMERRRRCASIPYLKSASDNGITDYRLRSRWPSSTRAPSRSRDQASALFRKWNLSAYMLYHSGLDMLFGTSRCSRFGARPVGMLWVRIIPDARCVAPEHILHILASTAMGVKPRLRNQTGLLEPPGLCSWTQAPR